MSEITQADIVYVKRTRGGYHATVTLPDGHWIRLVVTESAPWQRTTDYFRWTAKPPSGKGYSGSGRSRIEAIRDAVRARK